MRKTANTLYARDDLRKQAKKDIRYGLALHPVTYALFFLFAVYVDYQSIAPFQDLVLRSNETIAKALSLSIVFCIDVLISISLTKLVKAHFNQKKLNTVLIVSILVSIGLPIILMILQKILGTDVTIPDRGSTAVVSQAVKVVTQLLFSFVPLCTTVGLTVMGLMRENIKVFRKYRYLQLARAQATAEKDHISEALESDISTLKARDDSKFISAVTQLTAMRDTLFTKSREILAMSIGSPAATEHILSSKPVYRASTQYLYLEACIPKNPAVHVEFEDEESPNGNPSSETKQPVNIYNKEVISYEKESA